MLYKQVIDLSPLRQAALNGRPGRLKRVVVYAYAIGLNGIPAGDAFDEIEEVIWMEGGLPCERPSQVRAWHVTSDRARRAYEAAAAVATKRLVADVLTAFGKSADAAAVAGWRCASFANDHEIASALGSKSKRTYRSIRRGRMALVRGTPVCRKRRSARPGTGPAKSALHLIYAA